MLSVVANAANDEVSGGLSDLELYLFFSLLFSAGAETTRNAVAGGLLALVEDPASYAALRADLEVLPSAVEEMVRWTSPSPSKRRTATRDVELGGCAIRAGQKVQIWEGSANRDLAAFAEPDVFDINRKPNPHLGFGQGIHYCLGANLARLELKVLFEELLGRFASVQLAQPVEWTRSNRHTGIRHLCRFSSIGILAETAFRQGKCEWGPAGMPFRRMVELAHALDPRGADTRRAQFERGQPADRDRILVTPGTHRVGADRRQLGQWPVGQRPQRE